jgi:DNA-binding IclR family transcriptional regulator
MIHSILRAINILEMFDSTAPRLTLTEVSQILELPKSTAHNYLNTLLSRGYIEQTEDGRYALGTAVVSLTQAVRINVEFRDRAAPLLRALADLSHASVYLCSLDGDFVLYVYAIETSQRLRARTAIGDRAHLHCTAVGKAILSALSWDEVLDIVSRQGLPKFTETTITDLDDLRDELEKTRSRGYAVDRGEHERSNYCIGAPIFDAVGRVIGSCSAAGSDPEVIGERAQEIASAVGYAAQEISRTMGYVPARPSVGHPANPIPPREVGP